MFISIINIISIICVKLKVELLVALCSTLVVDDVNKTFSTALNSVRFPI